MSYYDVISKGYNELYGEEQKKKARLLKQHLKIKGLLLDIGAGTGISTEEFKKQATCILLDPSLEMLNKAKGLRICASAEALPFKDRVFDTVVSLTALHHVDLEKAIIEIERVARSNASIGISMLKKSNEVSKRLEKWKQIEEEKDIIYLRNSQK